MAQFLSDEIDFSAYLRETNPKVKVKAAALYLDDILQRFLPPETRKRSAEMFSTKLRDRIEFRPGEVTVWAGYNGHRKSMFVGQVALDLCVQRERVLMASFEMAPADTLARMVRQAFAVQRPATVSVERFSKWTDGRLWIFDHMGRISPSECMAVIRYFAQELRGTHVILDSMMMVCASEESLDEQKQFTTDVVRCAQEFGVHVHLIAHCRKPQTGKEDPPGKYDLRGSAAISDQAHNIITIWANKAKQAKLEQNPNDSTAQADPDARVCIEKQRNGAWEGAVKLWFNKDGLRFVDAREAAQVCEPYVLRDLE